MEWKAYLQEQSNEFNPLHYYLAQIALEVRRSYSKKPSRFKLKDFLITFSPNSKQPTPHTAEDRKARIQKSKNIWKAALGGFSKPKKGRKQ